MSTEKRKHERLPLERTVFIELVNPGDPGQRDDIAVQLCTTLDISRSGLRAVIDREVAIGSIIQVGVELDEGDDPMYLTGEVKWSLPDSDSPGKWAVGFELLNASDSDIQAWRSLLSEMDGST